MMKSRFAIAATAAVALSFAQPTPGQSDANQLGTVHFETSCKPEAQKLFDGGMIAIGSSGTQATANRLYPPKPRRYLKPPPSRHAHEMSAPLTGLSTKKTGGPISIIVPSRCVRMPKGKYMAGLRKSV